MFFHIRISEKSNNSHDETRVDLSEEELRARYISQYEAGEPIIINGKTISPDDIERVRVSRSDSSSASIVSELKSEDRDSLVVRIGGPDYSWRAADRATDVTDEFIKGPPGHLRTKSAITSKAAKGAKVTEGDSKQVFVVHGHDEALKNDMELFLKKIGLEPIVLHRQPDQGLTVIEKFERHSDVAFVVVLLTPDDVGYTQAESKKPESKRKLESRARQNVIFEFGYFESSPFLVETLRGS